MTIKKEVTLYFECKVRVDFDLEENDPRRFDNRSLQDMAVAEMEAKHLPQMFQIKAPLRVTGCTWAEPETHKSGGTG